MTSRLRPPTRTGPAAAALAALAIAAGALAGCASGESDEPGPLAVPSTSPTAVATTATTATTPIRPTETPTRTPKPKPSKSPTTSGPTEGSGDSIDDDRPSTAGGGICGSLGASEVGEVLGTEVVGSALGGVPGCQFQTADRRSIVVTVVDTPYRKKDGMASAMNDATSAVEGTPEILDDVGSAAFVVTGTVFGGEEIQGAGAVHAGDRLVNISLTQHTGLERGTVRDAVVVMLELMVDKV